MNLPLLSIANIIPLIGAAALPFVSDGAAAKRVALSFSLLTLAFCVFILQSFDFSLGGFQLSESYEWIPALGLVYRKGVDGVSMAFLLLSAFVLPVGILSAFSVEKRAKEFMAALLLLEALIIGVFTTTDLVLFYVFFEGVLIPMFVIIGVWGGEGRIKAAHKFFLYTLLGSVLMLLAVVFMVHRAGTSDMAAMAGVKFPKEVALWLWLAFFASFAVKTPVWPFHTWLPEAHVEAPTAGSVVLAGILLKLGGYGFIRISLRMFPEASAFFAPFVMALGVIAIIYASLAALAQTDMKKLIAYSSVAHMGYALIGIFSGNIHGIEGAVFVMLSHGLASAALFAGAGAIYERAHTRDMARLGGLAEAMPRCAFLFMIFTLCSVGLPGTFGFVGEFMVLNGAFSANAAYAVAASLGMVLGAAYMLKLYRALFWGKPCGKPVADLSGREFFMLAPLAVLIVWFGILPFQAKNVFEKTSVDMVVSYHGGGK